MIEKSNSGIIVNDTISDHLPIFSFIGLDGFSKKSSEMYKIVRSLNQKNISNFKSQLDQLDWKSIYEIQDVNEAYNHFLQEIKTTFDKTCPMKKVKIRKKERKKKPWLTKELLNCCNKKNNLY